MAEREYSYWAMLALPRLGSLAVSVTERDGSVIVTSSVLEEFGVGGDLDTALEDLETTLFEYRDALEARADTLGPELAKHLAYLRRLSPAASALPVTIAQTV